MNDDIMRHHRMNDNNYEKRNMKIEIQRFVCTWIVYGSFFRCVFFSIKALFTTGRALIFHFISFLIGYGALLFFRFFFLRIKSKAKNSNRARF